MKTLAPFALASLLLAGTAAAQTDADKALVLSLTPESLRVPHLPNIPDHPHFVCKRADLDGTGVQDYLVAAYSKGSFGTVLVIRPDRQEEPLVEGTSSRLVMGSNPRIWLEDLDGDGKPEIIVTQRDPDITWLFGWRGRHLVILGPTRSDGEVPKEIVQSQLERVEIGVGGDGKPELVSYKGAGAAHPVLAPDSNGIYQPTAATVRFAHHVDREDGSGGFAGAFTVPPRSKVTILVVDGDRDGHHRSFGPLFLNGQMLLSAESLDQGARTFRIPAISGEEASNVLLVWTSEKYADITVSVTLDP